MLLLGQHLYLDVNDFKDSIRWLFAKNDVNIKEFPVSPSQKKRWLLGHESWVQTKHTITKEPHPALHVSLTIGYLGKQTRSSAAKVNDISTEIEPRRLHNYSMHRKSQTAITAFRQHESRLTKYLFKVNIFS